VEKYPSVKLTFPSGKREVIIVALLLYVIFHKNTRKGRGHWLCKTKLASDKHPPYYTTLHRGCTVQIVGFTAFCASFASFL
jgi:hypothetical protein